VIERRRNGGNWYWAGKVLSAQSFKNTNLIPGSMYEYRVKSQLNGVNSATRYCGRLFIGSPTPTASSCSVSLSGDEIRIVVNGVSRNTEFIQVRNNGRSLAEIGRTVRAFPTVTVFQGLENRRGVQHFSVQAARNGGTEASNWRYCGSVNIDASGPVLGPAWCTAGSNSATSPAAPGTAAKLQWSRQFNNPTDNATHVVIYRQRNGAGPWYWAGRVAAGPGVNLNPSILPDGVWTEPGLRTGNYRYRIQMINSNTGKRSPLSPTCGLSGDISFGNGVVRIL